MIYFKNSVSLDSLKEQKKTAREAGLWRKKGTDSGKVGQEREFLIKVPASRPSGRKQLKFIRQQAEKVLYTPKVMVYTHIHNILVYC